MSRAAAQEVIFMLGVLLQSSRLGQFKLEISRKLEVRIAVSWSKQLNRTTTKTCLRITLKC